MRADPQRFATAPPIRAALGLFVCGPHTATVAEDYISDAGWQQVMSGFDLAKKARPLRSATTIEFVPIGSAEDEELAGAMERVRDRKAHS